MCSRQRAPELVSSRPSLKMAVATAAATTTSTNGLDRLITNNSNFKEFNGHEESESYLTPDEAPDNKFRFTVTEVREKKMSD